VAGRLREACRERGLPILAEIPDDPAVLEAQRRGRPLTEAFPEAPAARAIRSLAEALRERGFGGAGG
jgi:MinD superfamily P-loop ATPase